MYAPQNYLQLQLTQWKSRVSRYRIQPLSRAEGRKELRALSLFSKDFRLRDGSFFWATSKQVKNLPRSKNE